MQDQNLTPEKTIEALETKIDTLYSALNDLSWSRTILYDKDNKLIDNLMIVGEAAKIEAFLKEPSEAVRELASLKALLKIRLGDDEADEILESLKKMK